MYDRGRPDGPHDEPDDLAATQASRFDTGFHDVATGAYDPFDSGFFTAATGYTAPVDPPEPLPESKPKFRQPKESKLPTLLVRLLPENHFATIMIAGTILIIFIVLLVNR